MHTDNQPTNNAIKKGYVQRTNPVYNESLRVTIDYRIAEDNHCLITDTPGNEINCIKILRTQLLNQTSAKCWRTVMVTSVQPGEGKTVTAINLAFAMARDYQQTVALVDCDLRKPSIAGYLGIKEQPGLADHFLNDTPLNEIILWPGVEKLTLIAGSSPMPDPAEIIGSPRMRALVSEMKNRYQDRYVFFDFPPMLSVADPIAFIPLVDCVLLVVEAGRTTARDILKALDLIPKEKLLGMVLNKDDAINIGYY